MFSDMLVDNATLTNNMRSNNIIKVPQTTTKSCFVSSEQRSHSGTPTDGSKKPTEGGRTPKEKTVFNIHSLFKSKSASKESPRVSKNMQAYAHYNQYMRDVS